MAIYNKNGIKIDGSIHKIKMLLEHGNIAYGNGETLNDYSSRKIRFRSYFPIKVESKSTLTINVLKDSANIWRIRTYEYSAQQQFVQSQIVENNTVTVGNNVNYVRFTVAYETDGYNPVAMTVESNSELSIVKNFQTAITTVSEHFIYEVYPDVYTSGVLMLPPNYTIDGVPVPLLVFAHGSNGYATWNTELGQLVSGKTYLPYIEYLRDEGFAIFDCFGITSKYITSSSDQDESNTFGSHIVMSAFSSGIEYVLSRYNLDNNNINLFCKSLGGQVAGMMSNQTRIKLKTISMLCPWINNMASDSIGWTVQKRTMLADDWGLEGDVNNVFLDPDFTIRSQTGQAFLMENLPHIAPVNPAWGYFGKTLEEKFEDAVDRDYTNVGFYRDIVCPIKIWGAEDDESITYSTLTEFVKQCQNAGHEAILRVMPNGTGGHHSVDWDEDALKDDITTALGIEHEDVPLAYIEMVEFMRSRQ